MVRKWRFKVSNVACYNYWCNFELTPERYQLLSDMKARVYPLCELIIFEYPEDIILFTLRSGLDDFE